MWDLVGRQHDVGYTGSETSRMKDIYQLRTSRMRICYGTGCDCLWIGWLWSWVVIAGTTTVEGILVGNGSDDACHVNDAV